MRCKIKAESAGRMRIHAETDSMTLGDADVLEYYLRSMPFVTDVKVFDRTCDAIIRYNGAREKLIHALSVFSFDDEKAMALVPDHSGRSRDREYGNMLAAMILRRVVGKVLFPHDLKLILTVMRAIGFVRSGMSALRTRKLNVDVLDGSAITASILTDDHDTGSSIMFLLMNRTRSDYRAIITFNSMLIALGAGGVITPGTSAITHNASTILISLYNMTSLLETTKEVNHEKP